MLTVVVLGGIVWGLMIGLFAPAVRTMLHVNSPKTMVGRVMGTSQSLAEIAKLGPLVAAPALANLFGVQETLAVVRVVLIAIAALSWRFGSTLDETREMITDLDEVALHAKSPIVAD